MEVRHGELARRSKAPLEGREKNEGCAGRASDLLAGPVSALEKRRRLEHQSWAQIGCDGVGALVGMMSRLKPFVAFRQLHPGLSLWVQAVIEPQNYLGYA